MTSNRILAVLALSLLAGGAPLGAQLKPTGLPGARRDSAAGKAPPAAAPDAQAPRAKPGVIDGIVTDTMLRPLLGARVSVMRTNLQVATGANGRFRITDVPSGEYILMVRRAGFHATSTVLEVGPADTLRLSYTLTEAPSQLAPVVITTPRELTARMKEFEERRKRGQGEFMTEEEIDRHNAAFPTELIRLFKSVNVVPTSGGGGAYIYYPVSARATGGMTDTGQATCFMTVFVDNVPMPAPFNLDLLPSPREIGGIEVYAGDATIPIQYSGLSRSCGIILVWTKDGSLMPTKKKP